MLKKAIAAVEKHLDNVNFSTEEFASEMCMSRANLHLKLKALTGETTNDFIRKIRFNHACKLLKEGRYTISEISTKVGFNTASYFATSFKNILAVYLRNIPNQGYTNRLIDIIKTSLKPLLTKLNRKY